MNEEALSSLISAYKENAEMHGKASDDGDHKLANKCYKKLAKALAGIRHFGDPGNALLLRLIEDPNDSVVCWAASHSLKYNESKAVEALTRLAAKNGSTAFDAKMVLKQWASGELSV